MSRYIYMYIHAIDMTRYIYICVYICNRDVTLYTWYIYIYYIYMYICNRYKSPYIHGTNHSAHCEPSGITNAHSHIV